MPWFFAAAAPAAATGAVAGAGATLGAGASLAGAAGASMAPALATGGGALATAAPAATGLSGMLSSGLSSMGTGIMQAGQGGTFSQLGSHLGPQAQSIGQGLDGIQSYANQLPPTPQPPPDGGPGPTAPLAPQTIPRLQQQNKPQQQAPLMVNPNGRIAFTPRPILPTVGG